MKIDLSCPVPLPDAAITLAHGGGGQYTQNLLESIFLPAFSNPLLDRKHDGAIIPLGNQSIAFSTDSHVVSPLFYPGGDIGSLAVYGTVNDLAMCGSRPCYLSAGFIMEEGLTLKVLNRIVDSMKRAAERCAVQLVTGDTKVVDKGRGDGIYINTAGIGIVEHHQALAIGPGNIQSGDVIILSGDIGRHGMAIMAQREGLEFESTIESDCAPLHEPVLALLKEGLPIHCLRDCTRGGMATALIELASASGMDFLVSETEIAVSEPVRGACEILGLDPLYVANEGRMVCILPEANAVDALQVLKQYPQCRESRMIGQVSQRKSSPSATGSAASQKARAGRMLLKNAYGVSRILDLLSGEQLPRIC